MIPTILKKEYYWFLIAPIFTLAIYLIYGYQTGLDDSVEFLTFSKVINQPTLYSKDLFMQSMLGMQWNERTCFSYFFSLFPDFIWWGFIINTLLAYLLCVGVLLLSNYFLVNKFWTILSASTILFFLHNIDLGANTLYYNNIQGESFANTIIVWALLSICQRKILLTYILLVIATLFHPLIGLLLFLNTTAAFLGLIFIQKENVHLKSTIYSIFLYLIGCAWLLILIFKGHNNSAQVSELDFFNYTYNFTLGIHFNPIYFFRKGYLLHILLAIMAIIYFKKTNRYFLFFICSLLIGYFIYTIGFYFQNYLITSSWWFRTTMWLKLLGIISTFAILKDIVTEKWHSYLSILSIIGLLTMIYINWDKNHRLYPWVDTEFYNDELNMAINCKKLCDKNALFVQPIEFSALKFYGERSSFVEYPRIVRAKNEIKIWYDRLNIVYNLKGIQLHRNPVFAEQVNAIYDIQSDVNLRKYTNKGITHLILHSNHITKLPVIYKNNKYKLVKI
jgi:hypothetical protein